VIVALCENRIISTAYALRSTRDRKCDLRSSLDAQQRIAELETALATAHARIVEQDARIAALTKRVEELLEELGQNSHHSHLPPSSDPPGAGPQRKPRGKKRKRGGQQGHRGTFRELVVASQVDEVVNLFPPKQGQPSSRRTS
jgi:hypothetical protein